MPMKTYRSRRVAPLVKVASILAAICVAGVLGAVIEHQMARGSRHSAKGARATTEGKAATTTSPPALRLVAMEPANGATGVSATEPISLTFSSPLSSSSPLPTITPSIEGSWSEQGATMTFRPSEPFLPLSEVTLSVPIGASGVRAKDGGALSTNVVEQFQVENGSVLRLQQLLSLLDYSPLSWTPTSAAIAPSDASAQQAALYAPPQGQFSWLDTGWPKRLEEMWRAGTYNTFTKGLVMSFQADHALTPNGAITAGLWTSLIQALQSNALNTGGYNYALADKHAPETLTIWHDGKVVLKSPANTGIATSPTPNGTFPVYTRLRRQVMRGTNPDGEKYADLVQYIAYFHGNDAVHYMNRADYGIAQSLGCVELPLSDAAKAWPYLAYGTLVTVIS